MARLLTLLLCLIWIAGVGYTALQSWPTLPLDVPARDPQVQAALARAVNAHIVRHAIIALGPALVLVAAALILRRR